MISYTALMSILSLCLVLLVTTNGGDSNVWVRHHLETPQNEELRLKKEASDVFVDSGAILILPSTATSQQREDVLYSLLFAQMAADKDYQRQSAPDDWLSYFEYILQQVGWTLVGHRFDVQVKDDFFVLSSLALQQMVEANNESAEVIEALRKAFNALHDLSNSSSSIQVLYENTYDEASHSSNLLLGSLQVSPEGELELDYLRIAFGGEGGGFGASVGKGYTLEGAHRNLFHIYNTEDVSFSQVRSSKMVLNKAVYAKVRESIVKKLGNMVDTAISEVKISTNNF